MTSQHLKLQEQLYEYADNPQYECDRVINENIKRVPMLSTVQLRDILAIRQDTARLCKQIPYSREDIQELIENREVSLVGSVTKIEDNLSLIEFIFAKAIGEEY